MTSECLPHQVCELKVAPALGYGAAGAPDLGVPPNAELFITVELLHWVGVEDISATKDGSMLKRVLRRGQGWERARARYEVKLDLEVRRSPSAPVASSAEGLVVTLGAIASNVEVAEIGTRLVEKEGAVTGASPADLAARLETLLPLMQLYETAELRVSVPKTAGAGADAGAVAGADGALMCLKVRLESWTAVEEVPFTDGLVIKKILRESEKGDHLTPNEESICVVRYTVRRLASTAQGEGGGAPSWRTDGEVLEEVPIERPRTFMQSEGGAAGVLPCIDAAVRHMKSGELVQLTAAAAWAYGSPSFDSTGPFLARESAVVIELELLSFVRAKETWSMDGEERLAAQMRFKSRGNKLFARGEYRFALHKFVHPSLSAPECRRVPLGAAEYSRLHGMAPQVHGFQLQGAPILRFQTGERGEGRGAGEGRGRHFGWRGGGDFGGFGGFRGEFGEVGSGAVGRRNRDETQRVESHHALVLPQHRRVPSEAWGRSHGGEGEQRRAQARHGERQGAVPARAGEAFESGLRRREGGSAHCRQGGPTEPRGAQGARRAQGGDEGAIAEGQSHVW